MKQAVLNILMMAGLTIPCVCNAQSTEKACENPRGVYKLISIIGSEGKTFMEPFDQYKICTDSVTLMFSVSGNRTNLGLNDKSIFNYTGEEPDANNATVARIYNSDEKHFTLKWWSSYYQNNIFPHNDWCIENYESGRYSSTAKIALDAIMQPVARDSNNPFIGTWHVIGTMDELRDIKKELSRIHKENKSPNLNYIVLTSKNLIMVGGTVLPLSYDNKKSFTTDNVNHINVKWLNKNCIAVEIKKGAQTDYHIWERTPDNIPAISYFTSYYAKKVSAGK